jgi:hypothetical protein
VCTDIALRRQSAAHGQRAIGSFLIAVAAMQRNAHAVTRLDLVVTQPAIERHAERLQLVRRPFERRQHRRQQFRQHELGRIHAVRERQRLHVPQAQFAALGQHILDLAETDPRAQALLDIDPPIQRRIAQRRRSRQQSLGIGQPITVV